MKHSGSFPFPDICVPKSSVVPKPLAASPQASPAGRMGPGWSGNSAAMALGWESCPWPGFGMGTPLLPPPCPSCWCWDGADLGRGLHILPSATAPPPAPSNTRVISLAEVLYWSVAKLPRNQKQELVSPRRSGWCFRDRPDKRRQICALLGQTQNLNQTCTGIAKRAFALEILV